jgi:hypothetical protein
MREHLVVVLPGIGGSILARPGEPERPVWSERFRVIGHALLVWPQRLSLGEHEHLDPVGLIRTRGFCGWTVTGYDDLLNRLGLLPGAVVDDGSPSGYDPDATVVAVPYDFRRSICEAAQRLDDQVRARLAHLWPSDRDRPRVVVIAHSLGGLVARYWLAQQDNWRRCRALITLGTPHRGAPKALDLLANGVPVNGWRITRPVPVLREWPSVAELLPRYPAVVDDSPGAGGVLRRPHELELPWLRVRAEAAWTTHRAIEHGWSSMPRSGPEMVPRIGYGHGTPRHCRYDGHRVRVTADAPQVDGLGLWAEDLGDGTVPAYSGLPMEMDHHSPRGLRVAQRHGPIVDLGEISNLVESYEGRPPRYPVRGAERPVVLGLDADDVALVGASTEVTARIVGTESDVGGVAVWATLTGPDPHLRSETRLDWDSTKQVFRGRLPPVAAEGLARIELSAEAVPEGGDLTAVAWMEVLDGDRVE